MSFLQVDSIVWWIPMFFLSRLCVGKRSASLVEAVEFLYGLQRRACTKPPSRLGCVCFWCFKRGPEDRMPGNELYHETLWAESIFNSLHFWMLLGFADAQKLDLLSAQRCWEWGSNGFQFLLPKQIHPCGSGWGTSGSLSCKESPCSKNSLSLCWRLVQQASK